MRNVLSDLSAGDPGVGVGVHSIACRAHVAFYNKFHDKALLENGTVQHFSLDSEFNFQPHGVRFGPNKASVNEFDLLQSFYPLDAKCEKFLGFWLCYEPMLGWLKISSTHFAPEDSDGLLNAFGDINLGADAVDAHVCRVWLDANTAETAQAERVGIKQVFGKV